MKMLAFVIGCMFLPLPALGAPAAQTDAAKRVGVARSHISSAASDAATWSIRSEATTTEHVACVAERSLPDGVVAEVKITKNAPWVFHLTLHNVDFGMTSDEQRGLWQIDDNDPMQVYGYHVNQWTTSIDINEPPGKGNSVAQFRDGSKLNIVFGESRYVVDLQATAKMVEALKDCNARGQTHVDRQRIKYTSAAKVRRA